MPLKQGPYRAVVHIDLDFVGETFLSWTIRYSLFCGFSLAIEFGQTGDHIRNEIYISDQTQHMTFKTYMRLPAVGKFRVASRVNIIRFSMQI